MLPTWRPDKVTVIEKPDEFCSYIHKLEEASGISITGYQDLLDALQKRHDYFESMGCRLSDHGLDTFYAEECTNEDADRIFRNTLKGIEPDNEEIATYRTAVLLDLARMDCRSGWAQQFHIGPLRNNNRRMFEKLGSDTGFDAIGDKTLAAAGHKFFSKLAYDGMMAKTILYNLNPKDSEVMAAIAYTFNDGTVPGKMQYGAAWWFLDQEDGIRKLLNTLSSFGLLSRFVGMLTDSRSFLSYPRHEYFRRILCNVIGDDIQSGRLPKSEMHFIHQMVQDISYNNAKVSIRRSAYCSRALAGLPLQKIEIS